MQTFKKYLNPLHKDLDKVASFSDLPELSQLEKEEYPQLKTVTKRKVDELKRLIPRLENLEEDLEKQVEIISMESGEDDILDAKKVYNQILTEIKIMVSRINNELLALDSPYFGKIVFTPHDRVTKKPLILYIGKFALVDEETHIPIITDWRAPIANLYYQNSGPAKNVSFVAPIGKRVGNLNQKRQFQISRARIKGIYDAKSGNAAADEFLLAQLNERLGQKLQDIVSTIQAQQNEIIREEINKPVLIQGVAGSGKTAILLHRLAYLFYTYKEQIKAENSLIIAPNQMFIDYVSDVLPNLGVEKVDTLTYMFWAKKILGWNNNYTISPLEEDLEIKEYKGSIEFMYVLDKYFEAFEDTLLSGIPYSHKERIINRYQELKSEFPNIDMPERLDLAVNYAFAQKQFENARIGQIDTYFNNDIEKKKEILSYFSKNINIYNLYKKLFKTDLLDAKLKSYSLKALKTEGEKTFYRMEDLAPMVYLHQKIYGRKQSERDHIMIDEAQDISYIQLATLAAVAKNGNLTIAGDLAQSIIPPFYIKNWQTVLDMVDSITQKQTSFHQLQRCYRTTVEIIEYANNIFAEKFPQGYKLPEAVLRHGDPVEEISIPTEFANCPKEDIKDLVQNIKKQFEKGAVTCAVLCRDKNHAIGIYNVLKEYAAEIDRDVVNYSESDYKQGVLVLPIEQAKGLEFDSVYVLDINDERYPDTELTWRLLYVGMTRALHRLIIVHD
jgi:DNA helicase-2/ATP-dependent DNA helicase PcrA